MQTRQLIANVYLLYPKLPLPGLDNDGYNLGPCAQLVVIGTHARSLRVLQVGFKFVEDRCGGKGELVVENGDIPYLSLLFTAVLLIQMSPLHVLLCHIYHQNSISSIREFKIQSP